MVLEYNKVMGGVDLLNQNVKNYAIQVRLKKWYWALVAWFFNIQMVQAWRLYRHTWKLRHELSRDQEKEEEERFEESLIGMQRVDKDNARKEREAKQKKNRLEEKKVEEIPLIDFIRQSIEQVLMRHSDHRESRIYQREQSRLSEGARKQVRFDLTRPHLVMDTEVRGVCQQCKGRSGFRCQTCNVALHPACFLDYHK